MEESFEEHFDSPKPSRIYPLVSDRYKVVLVDAIVLIFIAIGFSYVLDSMGNVPEWVKIMFLSLCFLYEPLSISFFKGTVGHWLGNLKVVKNQDEHSKMPVWQSLLRTVVKYILGIYSLFTISTKNRGRAVHDMATGSIVLFTDEEKRLVE